MNGTKEELEKLLEEKENMKADYQGRVERLELIINELKERIKNYD